jgi:hypothetical protein
VSASLRSDYLVKGAVRIWRRFLTKRLRSVNPCSGALPGHSRRQDLFDSSTTRIVQTQRR